MTHDAEWLAELQTDLGELSKVDGEDGGCFVAELAASYQGEGSGSIYSLGSDGGPLEVSEVVWSGEDEGVYVVANFSRKA